MLKVGLQNSNTRHSGRNTEPEDSCKGIDEHPPEAWRTWFANFCHCKVGRNSVVRKKVSVNIEPTPVESENKESVHINIID